jgi:hypothetical protein
MCTNLTWTDLDLKADRYRLCHHAAVRIGSHFRASRLAERLHCASMTSQANARCSAKALQGWSTGTCGACQPPQQQIGHDRDRYRALDTAHILGDLMLPRIHYPPSALCTAARPTCGDISPQSDARSRSRADWSPFTRPAYFPPGYSWYGAAGRCGPTCMRWHATYCTGHI